jgi:hypothetical protein
MIQRGRHLRVALEPGHTVRVLRPGGRQHLDCHLAIQRRIFGAKNLAHAARAQRAHDLVRTQAAARFERHNYRSQSVRVNRKWSK